MGDSGISFHDTIHFPFINSLAVVIFIMESSMESAPHSRGMTVTHYTLKNKYIMTNPTLFYEHTWMTVENE